MKRGRRRPRQPFGRWPRPLRRRPFLRGRPLPDEALRRLRQAHFLRESGDPAGAARILEALADTAEAAAHPQAARLNLSAGRAWLEANETSRGMEVLQAGLTQMAKRASPDRMQHVYARVIAELRAQGLTREADAIKDSMPGFAMERRLAVEEQPPAVLPDKCPHCGGNIRGDEIEWIGAHQAICDYCGSTLKAQA